MRLKEALSVARAKEIFGIETIPNEKELKTLYKELVRANHPDLGGDTEAMSLINSAMDTLEPIARKGGDVGKISWEEIRAKYREQNEFYFDRMEEMFSNTFDPESLLAYLSKFTDDDLFISVDTKNKKDILKSVWESYSINYSAEVEVYNESRTTVFYIHYYISPEQPNAKGLSSSDVDLDEVMYRFDIHTDVYHDRRKYKMSQKNWNWRAGKKVLVEYEDVFPFKKLEDIFSENHVKKAFTKKDMLLGLERELPYVSFDKDVIFIYPFGKDEKFYFPIIRGTMMRVPYYTFNNVQAIDPKTNKYFYPSYRFKNIRMTMYETEETLASIVDVVDSLIVIVDKKRLDIVQDSKQIIEILESLLQEHFPKD